MKHRPWTAALLLALTLALGPQVGAGRFNITDVSYKTLPSSDKTATIVWFRAKAVYEGTVDGKSWTLQTELGALGTKSEGSKGGSGIVENLKIDNEPVTTHGANRTIPNCKALQEQPNQYHGEAIAAVYHQGAEPDFDYDSAS